MDSSNELNNARFISQDEISKDNEEIDTNACIVSDVSTIETDIEDIDDDFIIYTDDDVKTAKYFGVSVEELFKIYEEINNYEPDEPECNCEEWPVWGCDGGYEDEGLEESMY